MSSQPVPTTTVTPPAYIVTKADRLWNRMVFEINLLTNRLNWMVASQSFLFAAFFVGLNSANKLPMRVPFLMAVPLIGTVIALTMIVFCLTAFHNMNLCRNELLPLRAQYPTELQDAVDRDQKTPKWRKLVIFATYLLIVMFLCFWIAAGSAVWVNRYAMSVSQDDQSVSLRH